MTNVHNDVDDNGLSPETKAFYRQALSVLSESKVPYLVGGAYAFAHYTGITRHTKDLDIFVREADCRRALDVLGKAGFRTELTSRVWLGKAFSGENFVDIIFNSGNGLAEVDEKWFEYAYEGDVLGMPVKLCPPEEMIWQKSFIMERDRYDGADVAHLLRTCSDGLDWTRLIRRFGAHWPVLLSHLVLFGFIYPAERDLVPQGVMNELLDRLTDTLASDPSKERLCHGTLFSRTQYKADIEQLGYVDGRLLPWGGLTAEELNALNAERSAPPPHP